MQNCRYMEERKENVKRLKLERKYIIKWDMSFFKLLSEKALEWRLSLAH